MQGLIFLQKENQIEDQIESTNITTQNIPVGLFKLSPVSKVEASNTYESFVEK